jgi:hypothetical protein
MWARKNLPCKFDGKQSRSPPVEVRYDTLNPGRF